MTLAITILLSLTSPIVAVAITVWGYRRQDRTAELGLLFDLQERYLAPQVRQGRKLIHTKIAPSGAAGVSECTAEELSAIGHALAVMNTIGLCVESGRVEESLVQQAMGNSFASAVNAATAYIDAIGTVRGFRPYPYAERLAARFTASFALTRAAAEAAAELEPAEAAEPAQAARPTTQP